MAPENCALPMTAPASCHHVYRFADACVASTWPLPELPSAQLSPSSNVTLVIRPLAAPPTNPPDRNWIHHWPAGFGAISLGRNNEGDGFLLRFQGQADFVIRENALAIDVWPEPETTIETLRHLLLDQVLPRVLAQQDQFLLHAGAVRVGTDAIAFIGETGLGKSTLTASFDVAGYSLLSDDGVVLAQQDSATCVRPTYPSLRLWPEAIAGLFAHSPNLAPMAYYSRKQRVVMAKVTDDTLLPLAAVYLLAPEAHKTPEGISVCRLTPREACMAFIRNSFQLDVTDRRRATNLLAVASSVAQQVPVFSLTYPRNFDVLPDVREAILDQTRQTARQANEAI